MKTNLKVFRCRDGDRTRVSPISLIWESATPFYQLNYTAYHIYIEQSLIASCWKPRQHETQPHYWTCSDKSFVSSVYIRIPAAHSAFIISHIPLGLTLLPILASSDLSRRSLRIRNLPGRFRLYLRVWYRLFHSIGLSVSFAAVSIRYTYRLAPWLLYLLSDLN